tara:strand:+ start:887 stop:1567 length:681 start_codon:yes stop_codon:yes gene_type:complete
MAKKIKKTVAPSFATVDHGHDLPRIPVSPMFILVFVPTRWMIMEGCLVPQLSTIPLEPGTNLIEGSKKDGIRASRLSARLAEEGRIRIPFDWAPDGVSYVQEVQTRIGLNELTTYVSVWEEVYAGDSQTHPDSVAYAEWLGSLIASGKIPPCPPFHVRRMMDQEETRVLISEASVKAHDSGPNRAALEAHTANLAALKVAWATVNPRATGRKPVQKKPATPKMTEV